MAAGMEGLEEKLKKENPEINPVEISRKFHQGKISPLDLLPLPPISPEKFPAQNSNIFTAALSDSLETLKNLPAGTDLNVN